MNPLIIFGVVAIITGIFVLIFSTKDALRAMASTSWPHTEGTVTSSKVIETRRSAPSGMPYNRSDPEIAYEYTISGVKYYGSRIRFGNYDTSGANAEVATRPVGKSVAVFYNPKNPNICALEQNSTWRSFLPIGISLIFVIIGVVLIHRGQK
jgi:hypothetical protein